MGLVESGLTPVGFFETNLFYAFCLYVLTLLTSTHDHRMLFSKPRPLMWGVASQSFILPLIIIVSSLVLYMPLGHSTGLIIISAMPALTLGALFTWVARGNVTLSLQIIGISTFISIVVAPLILNLWANWNPFAAYDAALLSYSPVHTLGVGVGVFLIPLTLGLLTRHFIPGSVKLASGLLPVIAFLALLIPVGLIRNNYQEISGSILSTGLNVGLIYIGSLIFIYKLLKSLGLGESTPATIALTVPSQNAALAGLFLLTGLGAKSDQVLSGIWWVIFQYYGGLILALYWRRQNAF